MNASFDESTATIDITFPSQLVSTNAAPFKNEIEDVLKKGFPSTKSPARIHLDLRRTRKVDSVGLNVIFMLLEWASTRDLEPSATLVHRLVYMTFLNVRLDRKMTVTVQDE